MRNLIALAVLFVSSLALANKPIGPAGCGWGNLLFGKDSQILASTTNGTSGNQTFAITTGTSGCVDKGGMAKLDAYVEVNRVALANDVARGQGETVVGLSKILGCQDSSEVSHALRSNYNSIFPTQGEEAAEISKSIRETLRNSMVSCSKLG